MVAPPKRKELRRASDGKTFGALDYARSKFFVCTMSEKDMK